MAVPPSASRLVGLLHAGNRPPVRDAAEMHGLIMTAITDQRLAPATRLTEEGLAEVFGLGRRAVGTALDRLVWEGVVTRHPNRGALVASPTAREAREIFQARQAIETGVTEAVARLPTEAGMDALEANIRAEAAHRAGGRMREAVRCSGGFHVMLAEQAGNRILAEQVRLLVARTSLVTSLFDNPGGLACWHDEHHDLVALLRRRRVAAASALMRQHLQALEDALDLDRQPAQAPDIRDMFRTDR